MYGEADEVAGMTIATRAAASAASKPSFISKDP
jgi:hypothetical protein